MFSVLWSLLALGFLRVKFEFLGVMMSSFHVIQCFQNLLEICILLGVRKHGCNVPGELNTLFGSHHIHNTSLLGSEAFRPAQA